MIKNYKHFINENRFNMLSDDKYKSCLLSDITRMELIDLFLKNVENDEFYNIENPSYHKLVDDWNGYDDQVYIQNELSNNKFIYWEGWVKECWKAAYNKIEYKGLTKEEVINSIINKRFPRIGEEFDYNIDSFEYFKYNGKYIMKIVFIKNKNN